MNAHRIVNEAETSVVANPVFQVDSTRQRTRVRAEPFRAISTGLLASTVASLPALWDAHLEGVGLTSFLLLPLLTAVGILLSIAGWVVRSAIPSPARVRLLLRLFFSCSVASTVLLAGGWLANVALLSGRKDLPTIVGYGFALCVATWALFKSQQFAANRTWPVRETTAALFGLWGVATGTLGSHWSISLPTWASSTIVGVSFLAFTIGTWLLISAVGVRAQLVLGVVPFCLSILISASCSRGGLSSVYEAIGLQSTSHRLVLRAARALSDRDGDGFSAALGGGDCDDADATAYPLSPKRDCLGWRSPFEKGVHSDNRAFASNPVFIERDASPKPYVVLVTIDAFRCGFGRLEEGPLTQACPSLTAVAKEGNLSLDTRATCPSTANSMHSLHAGTLVGRPTNNEQYLASTFARAGYRTSAIITHPYLLTDSFIRTSFDSVDESLVPPSVLPAATTADLVTARAAEHVARLAGTNGGFFLWAHYYDPHAPYVRDEGTIVAHEYLSSYANEIRRVDASIGKFIQAIRQRPDAARFLVVVTGDHGEEFGEHGVRAHGASLYDTGLRVPLVAWSTDETMRARIKHTPTPSSHEETGKYIQSLVQGTPFKPRDESFFFTRGGGQVQFGTVHEHYKLIYRLSDNVPELYDLQTDPTERINLAHRDPARVVEMGRLLATHVADVE